MIGFDCASMRGCVAVAAHYHPAMSFDLVYPAVSVLIVALFVGLPLSTATAAIPVARLSAPPNRHELMSRRAVALGLFASFAASV
ncbi:hypothetical protein [Nonomuraea rubra]